MEGEPHTIGETGTREEGVFESGKYRALGRLDQGGMAEVFLAVARGPAGFNKLVVVKRLRDGLAEDAAHRELFLDEARLAARLNHANIVQTLEVAEQDGMFLIAMEYLEGQPLSRVAHEIGKRSRRVEPAVFARIVSLTLAGLDYAHELCDFDGEPLKIVHRDVSPQNIFLTYDGQVKLVDFGIAKAESSQTKTEAGTFKGKAAYMAPEQLIGETIDRRADIFTSGIVLWEMLARRRLMAGGSTAKTMMRIVNEDTPRLSTILPDIDPKLDEIVARALDRNAASRFPTARAMRDALEEYIASSGQTVRQDDLGALVTELFGEVRARVRRDIREQMATILNEPVSGVMVAASPLLANSTPPFATSICDSSAARLVPSTPSAVVPALFAAPTSRRRWPIVASAMAAPVVCLAIGALAFEWRSTREREPVAASASLPTASPSALATIVAPLTTLSPSAIESIANDAAAAAAPASAPPPRPTFATRAPDPKPAHPAVPRAASSPSVPPAISAPPDFPTTAPAPPPAATPSQQGRKYRKEL